MFGRLVCDHFSAAFHERCFVENRAGAGGLIGMAAAAQAAPDGYTLATSSIAYNVIAPAISPNPGFDPMKDFTHIAYIGGPPNVFVVNPALNVRSLAELVALVASGETGKEDGRESELKPFVAVQRVRLPPGKGAARQPEASLARVRQRYA